MIQMNFGHCKKKKLQTQLCEICWRFDPIHALSDSLKSCDADYFPSALKARNWNEDWGKIWFLCLFLAFQ